MGAAFPDDPLLPHRVQVEGVVIRSSRPLHVAEWSYVKARVLDAWQSTRHDWFAGVLHDGASYLGRLADIDCRHCGEPIWQGASGWWSHRHMLNRCQVAGRPYGYDAQPGMPGEPCPCKACERMGQTTPADNTGPTYAEQRAQQRDRETNG